MLKKWFARFGSEDNDNVGTVFDIHPDLAEAFMDAIRNRVNVQPPTHAGGDDGMRSYNQLTSLIAQTSRVLQHLEEFRELAIVEADKTHAQADRKGIAIAAGMPPSRLYRILERHGRPKSRKLA
ncbi:hypothetical protein [Streptomyces sp. NPDC048256]|uniref:hypothetical protein n=1 Tax=Streptomyces sp. NPDC048256 TaxID=3154613 RepID=UPI0033DE4CC5